MDVKAVKKQDAQNRLAFETHCGIIMRQTGVTKTVAMARAYIGGPGGLNALLVPGVSTTAAKPEATK